MQVSYKPKSLAQQHAAQHNVQWTAVAAPLPLAMGFAVTLVVAQVWRLVAE